MNKVTSRSEQLQRRDEFVAQFAGKYVLRLSKSPAPTSPHPVILQASIGKILHRQRTAEQLKTYKNIGADAYPYMSSRMTIPNGISTINSSALHALHIESQRRPVGVIGLENIFTSPSEIPSAINHVLSPNNDIESMTTPIGTIKHNDEPLITITDIRNVLDSYDPLITNSPARGLLRLTNIVCEKIDKIK